MKNIIFLFLLFAGIIQAQTTTKSFVLQADLVNYHEVIRVTNEDGSYSETSTLVGPASALANDQADKIQNKVRRLANAAYEVSLANKDLKVIGVADSAILALTTVSPLKVIQQRYQSQLLTAGWTIDQGAGAGFVPIVFTINGQNNLRYSINGAATKSATIYGDIITLAAYPSTGNNTDFYLSENGLKYFSLPNRTAVIKKP